MPRALINFNYILPTTKSTYRSNRDISRSIFNDWDFLFGGAIPESKGFARSKNVSVKETDSSYDISILAPGRYKEEFNISLEGNKLSVSLDDKEESENSFAQSTFKYSWKTPVGVVTENISASYDAGILNIIVTKPESEKITSEKIMVN